MASHLGIRLFFLIFVFNCVLISSSKAQDTITAPTNSINYLSNQNDWKVLGNTGIPDNNQNSFIFLTQPQNLNFDAYIGNLGALNLYGFDGQKVFINESNALEGVINDTYAGMSSRIQAANGGVAITNGGVANAKIDFDVEDDYTLEFTGDNLARINSINLSTMNSKVKFSKDDSVISSQIKSLGSGSGIIIVNANNIQFNNTIGSNNPIRRLQLGNNTSATLNEDASFRGGGLDLSDGTSLTLAASKQITFSDGANINFSGNGTLILEGNQDRSIVSNINNSSNTGGTIIYKGGAGKTLNLHGSIGSSNDSLDKIDLTAGGSLKLSSDYNSDAYINTIDTGTADGTVILKQTGLHINNFNHGNNLGTIIITDEGITGMNASTSGVSGPLLGAQGNPIKKLQFLNSQGGAFVNVLGLMEQTDIYADAIESNTPNTGVLLYVQGNNIIDAPIGTNQHPLAALVLNNDTTVELRQDAFLEQQLIDAHYEIGLSPGAKVRIKGNIVSDIAGVESIYTRTPTLASNGTIEYINTGSITHNGNIMNSDTINMNGDNVNLIGNAKTLNLVFNNDIKLNLTGNNNKEIIARSINASNIGTISSNDLQSGKTLTIRGSVGNPSNRLKLIEAKGGGNVEFTRLPADTDSRNVNVQTIDISGHDGKVIFNGGEHYGFNLVHDNHRGSLVLQSPHSGSFVQLNSGINLSSSNNYLKKILFQENGTDALFNVLAFPDSVNLYADSIETDAPNKGVILFGGAANSVNTVVGSADKPLRFIAVGLLPNSATLELKNDAYLAGGLGFYGNGLIKVSGNVYTSSDSLFMGGGAFGVDYADLNNLIKGTKGILEFVNVNNVVFDGQIDHLNLVKVSGNNVTVTRAVDLGALSFSNSNVSSTLTFNSDANIYNATTAGHKIHNIVFNNAVNIYGDIGDAGNKFNNINFSNNYLKPALINSNIYSSTISANNSRMIIGSDVLIDSDISGANTHLDFSDKVLTHSGHIILSGSPQFHTNFTVLPGGNYHGGHIELNNGSILDFSSTSNAKIILTASSPLPSANNPYKYTLFKQNAGAIIDAPLSLESHETNRYVLWSYDPSTYELTGYNNPNVIGDVNGNANNLAIANALSDPSATGNAAAIQNELGNMDASSVNNAINGLTPTDLSGGALAEASDLVEKDNQERISSQILPSQFFSINSEAGVASGDEETGNPGIWASAIYGKAIQKNFFLEPGYKTRSFGMTIGIDKLINDDSLIGASASNIKTIVNHNSTGFFDGSDKGRAESNILSLYGIKLFNNDLFMQGITYAGFAKLQNLEQRIINNSTILYAHSKYNSISFGAKLLAGKKYDLSQNFTILPSIGLRYNYSKDKGYKETGADMQNLKVDSKSDYDLEGIIGGSMHMHKSFNDITIKPEIQAYANYNIKSKPLVTDISIDGINKPIRIRGNKPSRVWYSAAAGIGIIKNITYESAIDKKYVSHTFMVKVRVNI